MEFEKKILKRDLLMVIIQKRLLRGKGEVEFFSKFKIRDRKFRQLLFFDLNKWFKCLFSGKYYKEKKDLNYRNRV